MANVQELRDEKVMLELNAKKLRAELTTAQLLLRNVELGYILLLYRYRYENFFFFAEIILEIDRYRYLLKEAIRPSFWTLGLLWTKPKYATSEFKPVLTACLCYWSPFAILLLCLYLFLPGVLL